MESIKTDIFSQCLNVFFKFSGKLPPFFSAISEFSAIKQIYEVRYTNYGYLNQEATSIGAKHTKKKFIISKRVLSIPKEWDKGSCNLLFNGAQRCVIYCGCGHWLRCELCDKKKLVEWFFLLHCLN